jgi:hypothetical protein
VITASVNVQSLFDHHEPCHNHRALPGSELIGRQPDANAQYVSKAVATAAMIEAYQQRMAAH